MSSIVVAGDTSGSVTLSAPAVAGSVVITLPTASGTMATTDSIPPAFAAGTVMLFVQTAAPTGWTKSVANDNKALRVVSGAASTGGSVAFTTAFASQAVAGTNAASGAYTLATADIPAHSHTSAAVSSASNGSTGGAATLRFCNSGSTGNAGGGGSHTHPAATFTGTAINLAVSYVDVIMATKN
jgi:hypothetical protein